MKSARKGYEHFVDRVGEQDTAMELPDRLLTVQDLAEYLGVPATTLYQWRYRREGPRGFRVGRHIRYQWSDVTDWIEHQIEKASQ